MKKYIIIILAIIVIFVLGLVSSEKAEAQAQNNIYLVPNNIAINGGVPSGYGAVANQIDSSAEENAAEQEQRILLMQAQTRAIQNQNQIQIKQQSYNCNMITHTGSRGSSYQECE